MFILLYCWLINLSLIVLHTLETEFRIHRYHTSRVSVDDSNHDSLLYNEIYTHPNFESVASAVNRPYRMIPYQRRKWCSKTVSWYRVPLLTEIIFVAYRLAVYPGVGMGHAQSLKTWACLSSEITPARSSSHNPDYPTSPTSSVG